MGEIRPRGSVRSPPAMEARTDVPTALPDRDGVVGHLEETAALHPLERHPERGAVPELCPSGP